MTKIDIYSGFLGAGKTTLIKKMIKEAYHGQKLVLIENEFGEIGIDGGFLQEAGIQITEMNSGCICCSLVGDFGRALKKVIAEYAPDRILIEPSGVGKLSDVIGAVRKVTSDDVQLGNFVTVADATKCKMYMKNFGEFYNNQIETANTIILSRTDGMKEEKLDQCVAMIREHNKDAVIVTTPWPELTGEQLMEAMEQRSTIAVELAKLEEEAHHHHHDHDDDDDEECDDPDCSCHHHHHDDDDEDEHEHHHHHHDHDEEDEEDEHEHHHHDHHDHEHEHHHHDHDHDHEGGEVEEYGIGTFVYYRRKPFDLGLFDDFVARKWPRDVVRAKGICYFDDERDMCYVFEQAGKQKTVKQAGQWLATMPKDELAQVLMNNPQLQKEWDQELGDRMIKIVFIGQHIKEQKDAIIAELDKCLA